MDKNNILLLLTPEERKLVKGIFIKKNSKLYNEGDSCDKLGILVKGRIDIVSTSYNGKEIIYNSILPGEMFGNNLLFSSYEKYKGDVIAKEESTLALIEKENLISILQSNKNFLVSFLNYSSNFGIKLNNKIKLLSFDNAKERFLFYLSENGNNLEFKNVTELAKDLFLTREAMSRTLSILEKEKVISRTNHLIKLEQ